jgi:hypothetical protein
LIFSNSCLGLAPEHEQEIGHLSGKQAASLAALAPHPRQSGKMIGYRATRAGRPEVKRAVFLGAMAAVRYNPALKDVYQRLIKNGKNPSSPSPPSCENSSSSLERDAFRLKRITLWLLVFPRDSDLR